MIEAITFDFWGTIFWPDPPPGKSERRLVLLGEALAEAGFDCSAERISAALEAALRRGNELIAASREEVPPAGWWRLIAEQLGLADGAVPFERVAYAFEEITLDFPPDPMPGVLEAIAALHGRYRLGVICNTGYTGGRVLRRLLDRHGILAAFDHLTFSDEFGRCKPDRSIFAHALAGLGVAEPDRAVHVGDLEDTDVAGALGAGLWAARYLRNGPAETRAHRAFHAWPEFPPLVADLAASAAGQPVRQPADSG